MAKFSKGQSGNLKGRPVGSGMKGRLERLMQQKSQDGVATKGDLLVEALYDLAMSGEIPAMVCIFNKMIPSAKATIKLSGKGSLTEQGKEVLKAMFAGEVEVSEADRALSTLLKQATIVERVDLEQRMTALEALAGERQIEHVRPAETDTVMWPTKAEPVVETMETLFINENGCVELDI
jgi:hypothetical protein